MVFNRSNQRINFFNYLRRIRYQSSQPPYYFGYGRTAFKVGLDLLEFKSGQKILAPNYICNSALHPFLDKGVKVDYYSVANDLSPKWSSVKEKLSPEVVAILMVHYFGIPQNIEAFISFSRENNLILIEDNSHGYGGKYKGHLLGTFGLIGISSPRKSFPILNGGVLFFNTNVIGIDKYDYPLESVTVLLNSVKDIIGRLLDKFPSLKSHLMNQSDIDYSDDRVSDYCFDKASYNTLNSYNLDEICTIRMNLYKTWKTWCEGKKLRPVFEQIEESVAPLSFPLIFDTKSDRDNWLERFKKNNIAAYLWPTLPLELYHNENTGKNLSERIFCLPIHLSMDRIELENFLNQNFVF